MTSGERLHHYLERFFALRQQGDDAIFKARLTRLQSCQAARLRASHADLLAQPALTQALEFILSDIYGGADLNPVARDIQRALPLALKLLPNKVMTTAATALEAAMLTQELDEALVQQLADKLDAPLAEADYIASYALLDAQTKRLRQLELVSELGGHLERYIRSRLLLGTFKLVKKPAHKAGFTHLYGFMERCFAVMQPVPNAQALLAELSAREAVIMQRLLAGDPTPFALASNSEKQTGRPHD